MSQTGVPGLGAESAVALQRPRPARQGSFLPVRATSSFGMKAVQMCPSGWIPSPSASPSPAS